jgi:AraC family transcriptional activator of pobA
MLTSAIPAFFLYGEPVREADPRFLHLESIAARSRPANWTIRPHAHRDLNHLLFVTQGGGVMEVEAARLPFRAPAVLISTADGHVLTLAEGYARELVGRMPDCRGLFAAPRALDAPPEDFAAHGFADDLEVLGRELVWGAPGRAMAIEGRLLCVLAGVLRLTSSAGGVQAAGPRAALVARFREAVERDFRTGAGIEDYGRALGVAPSRLRSACAAVAHTSPMALVHDRVMVEAKRMLLYTNMTVAEAAYDLGFDDPAYFSRFFAEREGRPPSAFRAAVRAGAAGARGSL